MTTDTEYQPKHRRDVFRLAVPARTSSGGRHDPVVMVRTETVDDQVVMTMSPAAAATLSTLLARAADTYHRETIGLGGFDTSLWAHVSIDLVRARTVVGDLPTPVYVGFGIPS